MVGHRLPKPGMRVRSPLPAPAAATEGLRGTPKSLLLSLAQEKRRYARGEISREEFENMRRDLLA